MVFWLNNLVSVALKEQLEVISKCGQDQANAHMEGARKEQPSDQLIVDGQVEVYLDFAQPAMQNYYIPYILLCEWVERSVDLQLLITFPVM